MTPSALHTDMTSDSPSTVLLQVVNPSSACFKAWSLTSPRDGTTVTAVLGCSAMWKAYC
jgi:hypothetical protein